MRRDVLRVSMSKNARLNRGIDQIELGFVEREATPKFAMKLGIQMHLAGLSLSNTVAVLKRLGVERARSTIHNWVHKADLQPNDNMNPNQVAVDETVIRLNDELYWLYMAVDPDTNDVLHTKLHPTRNHYTAKDFMLELIEKHDLDESLFLVDGLPSLHQACRSGFGIWVKSVPSNPCQDMKDKSRANIDGCAKV